MQINLICCNGNSFGVLVVELKLNCDFFTPC